MSASTQVVVEPVSAEPASTLAVTVGPAGDIPLGEGRAYDVGGHQVAIFRLRSGQVRAVQAVCPHRGGPLADGQCDARVVVCPLHAYAWDTSSGASTAAPGTGLAPVRVYPASIVDGQVVVVVPAQRVRRGCADAG